MEVSYFLAYDAENALYLVQQDDGEGSVTTHSSFHRRDIAANTVVQLNEREVLKAEA